MDNNLKMKITIECSDEKEQMNIGNYIHEQLVGNKDYIDSNILLNIDVENTIRLYIFKECEEIPTISI